MAHEKKSLPQISAADLEKVTQWAESSQGQKQFIDSQREVAKWAAEELSKASVIDPKELKRPFNL
jgi:hypothetical protein